MNILAVFLLALALCVDSLVVSTTCAMKSKMTFRRGLLLAAIFALFQGGFPLIGALLGSAFENLIESIDHWIAFGLLALVGLKMILDAFKNDSGESNFDVSRVWVLCTLGIATSIDAFVVGIGFGLNNTLPQILFTVLVITVVTFCASILGVILGKQNVPIPEKIATIIAGIVLIGLGVNTLIEHGVFL